MKIWMALCVVFGVVATTSGHTVHLGRTCPDVQAIPNLSIDKILGPWFVVYQLDTSNSCMLWNLTKSDSNSEELLLTETRQLSVLDALRVDHRHSQTAALTIDNPEVPGRMRVQWPTSWTGKADFTVFDTDYENYLAVFQCDRALVVHRRDLTVLSRTPVLDQIYVERVRRLMDTAGVSHKHLDSIRHNDCRKTSARDWHTEGQFFGLIPRRKDDLRTLSRGVEAHDISQIEIIGEGVDAMSGSFHGSLKDKQEKPVV